MADYKKLYYKMFNAVTDAEKLVSQAACMMRTVQQECEETYYGCRRDTTAPDG